MLSAALNVARKMVSPLRNSRVHEQIAITAMRTTTTNHGSVIKRAIQSLSSLNGFNVGVSNKELFLANCNPSRSTFTIKFKISFNKARINLRVSMLKVINSQGKVCVTN